MTTREELEDLLEQIHSMPFGPQEMALVQRVVAEADELGADDLSYLARLHLLGSASMTGDTEAVLTSFTWCLGKHDADPVAFPYEVEGYDLLWYFKHMSGYFSANPGFSLAQLGQMLDEMEQRYRAAGVGMSGVWQARFSAAQATGHLAEAGRMRQERDGIARDNYSHCEACVRAGDIDYFEELGQPQEALRLYDEIIEQGLSCGDEPESCESGSLLRLLRAGRLEDASQAHLRSYRGARNNPDGFPMMWHHLLFCAVTGNESRGLDILERTLHGLAEDPLDLRRRFHALLGYGVLLDAVSRAGHGDLPIRAADAAALVPVLGVAPEPSVAPEPRVNPTSVDPATGSAPRKGFTVRTLAEVAWRGAEELASRFDARNGTEYFSAQLCRARDLATEHYDLPIAGTSFVSTELPVPAQPVTSAQWLEAAYIASGLKNDPEEAVAAAERALALAESALEKSRAASLLASSLVDAERVPEAAGILSQRGPWLRELDNAPEAELEQRLGLLLYGTATAQDLPRLRQELVEMQAQPAAEPLVAVAGTLSVLCWQQGEVEQALEYGRIVVTGAPRLAEPERTVALEAVYGALFAVSGDQDAVEESGPLLERALRDESLPASYRATALRARAQVHGQRGEFSEGAALADRRVDLCLAAGARREVVNSLMLAAALYSDAGQDELAASRAQQAFRHGELAELGEANLTGILFKQGQYQLWSGQSLPAMETFDRVREREVAADEPAESLAQTLVWLGRAANASEVLGSAYAAWREAIELAQTAQRADVGAMAGVDLANLLVMVEHPEAVEVALQATQDARLSGAEQLLVQALDVLGRARAAAGDSEGLQNLDEAIGIAAAQQANWKVADLRFAKGRALLALGEPDAGAVELFNAADLFAGAGDLPAASMAELGAGRGYAAVERWEESLTSYRASLDRISAGSEQHTGISLEFAELLEGRGLRAEATAVRAAVRS
ncbi:hypothetical protein [Psychromicrobium xiongbiense]|uniref:hypothetical protein n=1 Tax=Psychromicrobium xiongbiense TaxID=3051184 RepID=UPI002552A49E|nr:hypothetical protein [Psychromicrobium sp. YIM S02556]